MVPSFKHLAWSACAFGAACAQTSTITSSSGGAADGLVGTPVSTSTQPASNAVLIDGTSTSFRVIPTLPPSIDETPPLLPNILDPEAIDAHAACPGYLASGIEKNAFGFKANLTIAGDACNAYGTDVEDLSLAVEYQSGHRLAVKISPRYLDSTNITRYQIAPGHVDQPILEANAEHTVPSIDLQFTYSNSPSFGFAVIRKSTGDILFDTRGQRLVFEDQFVSFVTEMPEAYNAYGLGEHIHALRLGNNFTATIYAADAGNPTDNNIYGTHPFCWYYLVDQQTGNLTLVNASAADPTAEHVSYSHGVYLRNSHAHEVLMSPKNITWRTLGGNVDLYFYDGPTASDVVRQYQTSAAGLPAMHQYFTLGFHQCRWGYANWSETESVVDTYRDFNIPLETIWNDIDIYNQYRDFDNDQLRFSYDQGKEFLGRLKARGQHYVPIVDSAIYIPNPLNESDAYATYTRGNDSGVFLKNPDGTQYIGSVWPGYTVFPDWRAENTSSWWTDELKRWHELVDYSGIWIDMSEVSSFCVGPSTTTSYLRTTPTPGVRNEVYPPYVINNVNGALAVHAVSPNATHADGTSEYDIHNLFGHEILNATYNALTAIIPGKRPFVVGRSTFAGSGKFAGHWGGDNKSKFWLMAASIPQALSMSIFGIPMFGPDVCGFDGQSSEELCSRWMQLGAEAYVWESVAEASRKAMHIRYSLLPYMYTLLYQAHTTGSTFLRALSWEFPNDPQLVAVDRQFLLGPSIMITPVLVPGASTVDAVFPGVSKGQIWYDWYNQTAFNATAGKNTTIAAPLGHIPVFIRGGSILPTQAPGYTTSESRKNPWALIAALDMEGSATGSIYLDDGESISPNATKSVDLTVTGNALYASSIGTYEDKVPLANVTILGVPQIPSGLTLNGETLPMSSVDYNTTSKVLRVTGLANATSDGAWANDWALAWSY
ncbi:hypothetical protein FH972_026566 [Carpinus fangiana]|uniref:Uncharacterized protein n=1 Tax=Carpinus fangiana TaxID=176857 RepID=A0A5N6L4N6_9ROSI|nr:hypothetical protein FH972_026566 [Carpinus fangiana]